MPYTTAIRFNAAKLLQTDINAWKTCTYKACIKKQSCLGGARGTCKRTNGWPLCTIEGQARMKEAKTQWQRSKTYDNETQSERGIRRLEAELRELDIMLKTQGM